MQRFSLFHLAIVFETVEQLHKNTEYTTTVSETINTIYSALTTIDTTGEQSTNVFVRIDMCRVCL
jgi:DNA-binding transcriptional regulator WhiA